MVWYVMKWYGMVWYGMVWYGMAFRVVLAIPRGEIQGQYMAAGTRYYTGNIQHSVV